jgi:hypothetical protein
MDEETLDVVLNGDQDILAGDLSVVNGTSVLADDLSVVNGMDEEDYEY